MRLFVIVWAVSALGCSSDRDDVFDSIVGDDGSGSDEVVVLDATVAEDVGPPVSWSEVQVVYARNCVPCHQSSRAPCSGQTCFVSSYEEAIKPSFACPGLSVAGCNAQRAEIGNMPPGPRVVSADDLTVMRAFANHPARP